MAIKAALPKYAAIVNAVQERIENGSYRPGTVLPSEADFVREFSASRPTVVRALDMLRQDGWIDSQQGKGRFVVGVPDRHARRSAAGGYATVGQAEVEAGVKLLHAGPVLASNRAAFALGVEPGTPVIARRRLLIVDQVGPVELGTAYVPVELAVGTDLSASAPLPEGLLKHISARRGIVFDHATERVSARMPTTEEAGLLEMSRREPVLTVLLSVCDRTGAPLVAVDVVMPASRHELEDVFPVD